MSIETSSVAEPSTTVPTPIHDSGTHIAHQYPPSAGSAPAENVVESIPSETKKERQIRIYTSYLALWSAGWTMGGVGALIPSIEEAYNLNYARVSVLFIVQFFGYLAATSFVGKLTRKIGCGRSLVVATGILLCSNILNAAQHSSFVPMCIGFFFNGLAIAMELGIITTYFALLPNPLVSTGFLHGAFGLGAFASPLVSTAMITRGVPFNLFYATSAGMNIPMIGLMYFAFRKMETLPVVPGANTSHYDSINGMKYVLKSRAVWTLSLFLMLYVGAEESIGGWIVSYILEVRHGSPQNASIVASTFYLGLALGRFALPTLNVILGERRAIFMYILLAMTLLTLSWLIPNYASTASLTCVVGISISTFYAAAVALGGRLIPRQVHGDAFSLMSSVAQSGSALFPLVVGLVSTKKGIWVLEPAVVSMLAGCGVLWFFVPKEVRRMD